MSEFERLERERIEKEAAKQHVSAKIVEQRKRALDEFVKESASLVSSIDVFLNDECSSIKKSGGEATVATIDLPASFEVMRRLTFSFAPRANCKPYKFLFTVTLSLDKKCRVSASYQPDGRGAPKKFDPDLDEMVGVIDHPDVLVRIRNIFADEVKAAQSIYFS